MNPINEIQLNQGKIFLIINSKLRKRAQIFYFQIFTKENHGLSATECYTGLGCLSLNASWYSIERPVNVFPQPRDYIRTNFTLFTRQIATNVLLFSK